MSSHSIQSLACNKLASKECKIPYLIILEKVPKSLLQYRSQAGPNQEVMLPLVALSPHSHSPSPRLTGAAAGRGNLVTLSLWFYTALLSCTNNGVYGMTSVLPPIVPP